MPLYQQLIMALPKTPNESLAKLFKRYSKKVIEEGGAMRGIENHGIRPLPEMAKRFGNLTSELLSYLTTLLII